VSLGSASYAGLQQAVTHLRYKTGWSFWLTAGATSGGGACTQAVPAANRTYGTVILTGPLFLVICAAVTDTGTGKPIRLEHWFSVPPEGACGSWLRWLLDRILDVERHETCEAFDVAGWRPFYPEHGPAAALYAITERPAPVS
jgi:hypothetical protein